METSRQLRTESPLYIRWGPDRSPYAIELKLELVEKLRSALVEGIARNQEVGGILIGCLPTPQAPTIRVEDVELLERSPEDHAGGRRTGAVC